MERGLGFRRLTMSPVELQARIKERVEAKKQVKLTYRGLTYIVKR